MASCYSYSDSLEQGCSHRSRKQQLEMRIGELSDGSVSDLFRRRISFVWVGVSSQGIQETCVIFISDSAPEAQVVFGLGLE